MAKKIIIVLSLVWLGIVQAMYEPVLYNGKNGKEECSDKTSQALLFAPYACDVQYYNAQQFGGRFLSEPYALTTAARYGSDLPTKIFDELTYAALPSIKKPWFSSDHVLCTSDQLLKAEEEKKNSKNAAWYAKNRKVALENIELCRVDIQQKIASCIAYEGEPIKYALLKELFEVHQDLRDPGQRITQFYEILVTQSLEMQPFDTHKMKSLSAHKKVYLEYNSLVKDLVKILIKLQDDKRSLEQNNAMTEQNIVRILQIHEPSWPVNDLYSNSPFMVSFYHDRMFGGSDGRKHIIARLGDSCLACMPVFHANILSKKEGGVCQLGIYWRSTPEDMDYFLFTDRVELLPYDPRCNPNIHGPNGAVFFKFPHDSTADYGPGGEGSSWMHLDDARIHLKPKITEMNGDAPTDTLLDTPEDAGTSENGASSNDNGVCIVQ